jgi:hypothetical protein
VRATLEAQPGVTAVHIDFPARTALVELEQGTYVDNVVASLTGRYSGTVRWVD